MQKDGDQSKCTLRIIFCGKALYEHLTLRAAGIVAAAAWDSEGFRAEVSIVKVGANEALPFYVKTWKEEGEAIMFHIGSQASGPDDRIVQACFPDGAALVLSTKSKVVTQVNPDGKMQSFILSNALNKRGNGELAKRLQLVRDMIVNILAPASSG